MMVERLQIVVGGDRNPYAFTEAHDDGDYVFYSDCADLERQIADLRAELSGLQVLGTEKELRRRAEAAEAENARLRALPLKDEVERVLEPFAEACEQVDRGGPDNAGFIGAGLTLGELRAARALLSRLRAGEQEGWRPDLLDKLAEHTNLELSWGAHPDDNTEACWQVHRVNGGPNDREWTLVGVGNTPREALYAALPAAPSEQGGDRS